MTETSHEPGETLTGVVNPLEGYGDDDREARPFEDAHAKAVQALALTQERLTLLRKQRTEINAEIKELVDDEDLLTRMTRVRKGPQRD